MRRLQIVASATCIGSAIILLIILATMYLADRFGDHPLVILLPAGIGLIVAILIFYFASWHLRSNSVSDLN